MIKLFLALVLVTITTPLVQADCSVKVFQGVRAARGEQPECLSWKNYEIAVTEFQEDANEKYSGFSMFIFDAHSDQSTNFLKSSLLKQPFIGEEILFDINCNGTMKKICVIEQSDNQLRFVVQAFVPPNVGWAWVYRLTSAGKVINEVGYEHNDELGDVLTGHPGIPIIVKGNTIKTPYFKNHRVNENEKPVYETHTFVKGKWN
jgi:hypothetical protein